MVSDTKITFATDYNSKVLLDELYMELKRKGIFRSKSEMITCLIGWLDREKDKIDWKDVRFFNMI